MTKDKLRERDTEIVSLNERFKTMKNDFGQLEIREHFSIFNERISMLQEDVINLLNYKNLAYRRSEIIQQLQ